MFIISLFNHTCHTPSS